MLGIDTNKAVLYGIDQEGQVYVRKSLLMKDRVSQVQDEVWDQLKNQASTKAAKNVADSSSLPVAPNNDWIFSLSGQPRWAGRENYFSFKHMSSLAL